MFKAICKADQLVIGEGVPVVVCGWTPVESIKNKLNRKDYSAIGQLYSSSRGISFLVRNLLANPEYRTLVLLSATKADTNSHSVEVLRDFIKNGVVEGISATGNKCWVIQSEHLGYIDADIPYEALNQLRYELTFHYFDKVSRMIDSISSMQGQIMARSKPLILLPLETTNIETRGLKGDVVGHSIVGDTLEKVWLQALNRITSCGVISPHAHGGSWQELLNLTCVLKPGAEGYKDIPSYAPVSSSFLELYQQQFLEDSCTTEKYTYGQRLRSHFGVDQVKEAINNICSNLNSSRIVLNLWDEEDYKSSSPPCLNHICLRVIKNKLNLTATFRSHDMYSAWLANVIGLISLQEYIVNNVKKSLNIDLEKGDVITNSLCAHIYDDCWDNTDIVLSERYKVRAEYKDPVGNFVVTYKNYQIVVEHTTSKTGEVIYCYIGRTAKEVYQKIAKDFPHIEASHALYLGTELAKAEIQKEEYKQDR